MTSARALVGRLIEERRKAAGQTQVAVALRLGRAQSLVAEIEAGRRRIDLVEMLEVADAIGFDPVDLIKDLQQAVRSLPENDRGAD